MNNTKRILQYLLIVVGIIVPIYLGNVLKMNTASDSGVALKDIPAEAVTCTGAAQGMNGPVTVEVVATKDRIYSVKVVDQKETEGIGTVAAVEIPAKIFEKQSVQVDSMTGDLFGEIRLAYWHDGETTTIVSGGSVSGNMRETNFLAWTSQTHKVTSSKISDFEIDGITFEVGGKNKKGKQIKEAEVGYLVKDDLEFAAGHSIPIWMFGFIY